MLAYHDVLRERGWARAAMLQRTDPPLHSEHRKLLNRVFTPAPMKELRLEFVAR